MPIRPLTQKDKNQVLALDEIIFNAVDSEGGWRDSDFNQFYNEEGCYVFCDEERPDTVLGYIFAAHKEDHTYISNLGSDPRVGKRGIGTALMEQVMLQEDANSKKNKRPFAIKLHVDMGNVTAIQFYKNLGFTEEGRDHHGIKMRATDLPEKFKKMVMQPSAPRSRKALIIRNVEVFAGDELKTALAGLVPSEHAPHQFNELLKLVLSNPLLDRVLLDRALALFKLEGVRDYIYETVKATTGNHVIYHLNGLEDGGRINDLNAAYITEKLAKIPLNTDFDLLYLGGGHGDPVLGSSNLSSRQLKNSTDILSSKHAKFSAVILGSCFSTAYAGLYQPLLKDKGVMVSNSLESGGSNNFLQAMEWMQEQRQVFYSEKDIQNSIKIPREVRSSFRRVLEGRGLPGEEIADEYTKLLNAYKQRARDQLPAQGSMSDRDYTNRINNLSGDLFNAELDQIIIKMQSEKGPLNKEEIQNILREYPLVDRHIKEVAKVKDESAIFDALINTLKPTPTSIAVGSSTALTLFNFSSADAEKPPEAGEHFKENYRSVLRQVRDSARFARINEVNREFDVVLAKRLFNELFAENTITLTPPPVIDVSALTAERARIAVVEAQAAERARIAAAEARAAERARIAVVEAQAAERARSVNQQYIVRTMKAIDLVLTDLKTKIETINPQEFPEARRKADFMWGALKEARNTYERTLLDPSLTTDNPRDKFKSACTVAITEALSTLENVLGWGDYLLNALKTLVSNVITLGGRSDFFPRVQSQSALDAKDAGTKLDPDNIESSLNP